MANVEFKDKYKMTPLMRAAQKGNVDMVNYLINTAGSKIKVSVGSILILSEGI